MTTGPDSPDAPRTWLLMGHKAGDNTQLRALAEGLGWPFETKHFVYRKTELATNLLLGPTLAGIVKPRSSGLEPPWPDLVVSAGRRNEPVARWIRRRAGGAVKLVHFGRPWSAPGRFDLIVTTPQYDLPARPNVLHNETLLHRITAERLAREAETLAPRVAHLPGPYVAVLVGGSSGPYRFTERAARRLARQASALARADGGSLLVTTSARTPPGAADALEAALEAPAFFYRWRPDAADNPYFGLLGLARSLVVSAESVSMVTEACASGKAVHLFDLGEGPNAMRAFMGDPQAGPPAMPSLRALLRESDARAVGFWAAMRFGPRRLRRDVRRMHRVLLASGRAVWLGEGAPRAAPPPLGDLDRAVARVRALFAPAGEAESPSSVPPRAATGR